jgi:hypothetical protein
LFRCVLSVFSVFHHSFKFHSISFNFNGCLFRQNVTIQEFHLTFLSFVKHSSVIWSKIWQNETIKLIVNQWETEKIKGCMIMKWCLKGRKRNWRLNYARKWNENVKIAMMNSNNENENENQNEKWKMRTKWRRTKLALLFWY